MKKVTISIALLVIVLASLALVGFAYAQTQTPPNPDQPYGDGQNWGPGRGMMGSSRGMMGGRWNRSTPDQATPGSYGPMHEYMISSMATVLNLTPEELEARHAAGETMWDIAQAQGLTQEQFQETMIQARTEALNQVVAEGLITQEQADWMLSRMNRMGAGGSGPGAGGCPGMGGGFQGQAGGGGWNR